MSRLPLSPLFRVAGCALGLLVVERWFPLRERRRASLPRLAVNAVVSATTLLVALVLIKPTTEWLMAWEPVRRLGLLPQLGLHGAGAYAAGFLLMDLSFYYWHVANHKLPLLWRFHNVHHTDPDLDVTTGFRFHPGEVAISTAFRAAQVAILGVSPDVYLAYETVFQACTYFHHANLRLPIGLEGALNWMFVTPRMHGIHHSDFKDETDSNFSVVFSVWDRLHGSLGLGVPQRDLVIGMPGYGEEQDNRLAPVLALPFRAQREYWKGPSGLRLSRGEAGRRSPVLAA